QAVGQADAAERKRDELDDAEADREQHGDEHDDQEDAAKPRDDPGGGRWDEESDGPQREQLAATRRGLPEALDGVLEVSRATFRERERRVGHAPQLHALLRAGGGDGTLEIAAGLLGVEALCGTCPENRKRRG